MRRNHLFHAGATADRARRGLAAAVLASAGLVGVLSLGATDSRVVAQGPFDGPAACSLPGMVNLDPSCNPYQFGNQNPGATSAGRGSPVTSAG